MYDAIALSKKQIKPLQAFRNIGALITFNNSDEGSARDVVCALRLMRDQTKKKNKKTLKAFPDLIV